MNGIERLTGGIARERAEAAKIEREFPGWTAWVGMSSLWHARRTGVEASPASLVTGEDAQDLRDEITRWTGNHP